MSGGAADQRPIMRIPKMAELVAADLRRQIVRGELTEGATLPQETLLLEQYEISRPTLREAFRILESEALISVRRGARGGARVHSPDTNVAARYLGLILEYRDTPLADVYKARKAIEPYCVRLLATHRTEQDLELLTDRVEGCEAAADESPDRFIRLQNDFHACLVELAGNETLKVLSGMLRHILDTATWKRMAEEPRAANTRRAIRRIAHAHRQLLELIAAGDADGAEQFWRKHLTETNHFLLEIPPDQTILEMLG